MRDIALDQAYTAGWYREQTPAWQRFILNWQGFEAAPGGEGRRYLDLGCGLGVTASWVSLLDPDCEVVGLDGDPRHVAMARAYAGSLGASARFVEGRFEALGDLGSFDAISLHGVWSWISREARAAVIAALPRLLRPGGSLYLGYNALPGKVPMLPVQRLFREIVRRSPGEPTSKQLRAGMVTLKALAGQGYLAKEEGMMRDLEGYASGQESYLMHELLVAHWEPQLLCEVAAELDEAGMRFVGSANMLENFPILASSEGDRTKLNAFADEVMRRTVRDFMVNTAFRRDVFARGLAPMGGFARQEALLSMSYALSRPQAECVRVVQAPSGEVTLDEGYDALVAALVDGPKLGRELPGEPEAVVRRMGVLVALGYVEPGVPVGRAEAAVRQANERSLAAERPMAMLASVKTGHMVSLSRLQVAVLRSAGAEDRAGAALADLARVGQLITHPGRDLTGAEAQRAEMELQIADFDAHVAPALVRRGFLDGAASTGSSGGG